MCIENHSPLQNKNPLLHREEGLSQLLLSFSDPLITAGIGTNRDRSIIEVAGLHRASPSATLDKRIIRFNIEFFVIIDEIEPIRQFTKAMSHSFENEKIVDWLDVVVKTVRSWLPFRGRANLTSRGAASLKAPERRRLPRTYSHHRKPLRNRSREPQPRAGEKSPSHY
jgi:hypothetical protein